MSADSPQLHGRCEPAFESLRRALTEVIETGAEVGAALAVHVGTQPVVDLWAGHQDSARTRPWDEHTIVNLYSVGKAVTAVCALRLVEGGALDLDSPVSRYWPEFAQAGKKYVPVRFLMTHQAALPAVFRLLPLGAVLQWEVMTEALAAQEGPSSMRGAPTRSGPPLLRALRRRRLARVRRSRCARRLRIRDESGPGRVAAQARAPPHRSGVRGAVAL